MSTRLGDDDAGRDAFEPGLIGATSRQTGVKACGSGGSVILANSIFCPVRGGSGCNLGARQRVGRSRPPESGAARGSPAGETGCLARNTASSQSGATAGFKVVGLIDRLPVIAQTQ
jgi:hypothetical protein